MPSAKSSLVQAACDGRLDVRGAVRAVRRLEGELVPGDRQRRPRAQLGRPVEGIVEIAGSMDEPGGDRPVEVDRLGAQEHRPSKAGADQVGDPPHRPLVHHEAETSRRNPESRRVRRHTKIARTLANWVPAPRAKPETAAIVGTLRPTRASRVARTLLAKLRSFDRTEVGARAEVPAHTGQDDDPHVGVERVEDRAEASRDSRSTALRRSWRSMVTSRARSRRSVWIIGPVSPGGWTGNGRRTGPDPMHLF